MNDVITTKLLLDALGGAGDRAAAARIVEATIAVLFQRLTTDERSTFARALSPGLCAGLSMTAPAETFGAEELYARVAERARVDAGTAREETQVILETIGRHAPWDVLRRLAHGLPPEIAALFEERELGEPPPYVETFPSAQAHSVIREDNPHGERKLSSGKPIFRPSDAARAAR